MIPLIKAPFARSLTEASVAFTHTHSCCSNTITFQVGAFQTVAVLELMCVNQRPTGHQPVPITGLLISACLIISLDAVKAFERLLSTLLWHTVHQRVMQAEPGVPTNDQLSSPCTYTGNNAAIGYVGLAFTCNESSTKASFSNGNPKPDS